MGTKTDNKIDYTNDPRIDNGGGFPLLGFGRIPSQQTRIDEKMELLNLLKDYCAATLIIFGLLILFYVCANLIWSGSDWYDVVNIVEIGAGLITFWLLSRALSNRYDGRYIFGDSNGMYLNTNTIIAFGVALAGFIYIHINTTDFWVWLLRFPEEQDFWTTATSVGRTAIILFTVSIFAPSVAMAIRLILFEILDRYHSAIEVRINRDKLALDWAKFNEDNDRYWDGVVVPNAQIAPPTASEVFGRALVVSSPDRSLPQPADDMLYGIVSEFLDGLDEGRWGYEERSWKGKRLKNSGYDLTSIGDKIRDLLIRTGWAEWNHPEKKNLGWRLKYTPDQIKKGMLISGRKLSFNPTNSSTGSGNSQVIDGDLSGTPSGE